MRLDNLIAFVPLGAPLAILGAPVVSPQTVDLAGPGVGQAVLNIFGTTSVYGAADGMGVGRSRVEMAVATGAAFVGGTSLNIQMQGAIDNGANQPGPWNTFYESGTILTALLTAGTVIFRFPWLPPFPFNLRPRFLRLNFVPAGTFTGGTIAYAVPSTGRDDYAIANAPRNYVVA